MSVADIPARAAPPPTDIHAIAEERAHFALTLEQLAYIGLFVLALLAHLWGLGDRALHHDETLHAAYSWRLYQGQGFMHDPLLHGPFLYHIVALMYYLFGDSDFTARLSVALFGSALVVMPYLIRRELGRGAALLAATYLLISPVFLYVGRFIRHDMYAVVFELLTVISIVRYGSTRQARWLYIGAASLGLMATDMETFYLYTAMIGALLVLVFLWRVWRPGIALAAAIGLALVALVFVLPGKPQAAVAGGDAVTRAAGVYVCPSAQNLYPPANPMVSAGGPIFGWSPLATADNDYALCVRNQYDDNFGVYFVKLGQFILHPAILLALLVSVAGIAALYMLIWRRRDAAGASAWSRARALNDGMIGAWASLGRDPRVWIALAVFLVPYVLLFTAFFGHPTGIVSGAAGSLLYWLAQHNVQRGGQPDYYYLIQMIVYEPLALLWGTVGLVMALVPLLRYGLAQIQRMRKRAPVSAAPTARTIDWGVAMPALLAWWAVGTLAMYSWAGEKMPWLTVHVALPYVLLGAWALARILSWWAAPAPQLSDAEAEDRQTIPARPKLLDGPLLIYLGMFAVVAGLFFLLIAVIGKQTDAQQYATAFFFPATFLLLGLLTLLAGLWRGARWSIGALALGLTLVLGLYGVRSAYQLSYRWGDDARELMIFVQTSPDVPRVIRNLEQAATRRNGQLALWYDNETVWQWYLRNFPQATQQQPAIPAPTDDLMAVLMLQENIDANPQNLTNLSGFRIQRLPLRWWNPEAQLYRLPADWTSAPLDQNSAILLRMIRTPLDGRTAAQFWQYMFFRQLPAPLGSTDFVIAVRPELANEIGLGTGVEQK